MSAPTRGPDRIFRVLVLSLTSLLLACGAHLGGGGSSPPAPALLLAALLVIMISAAVTARRCRLPLLLFVVSAEQLGLHVIFGAGAGAAATGRCAPTGLLGHHHAATCSPTDLTGAASGDAATAMTATHLLAVLITVWLLSRGEAWLWAAADLVIQASTLAPTKIGVRATRPLLLGLPAPRPNRRSASSAAPRGPPVALGVLDRRT